MRFHVLGIGSIGTLVAHNLRLAQPNADVCLIVRNAALFTKPRLREPGATGPPSLTLQVAQKGGDTTITSGYELDVSNPGRAASLSDALEGESQEQEIGTGSGRGSAAGEGEVSGSSSLATADTPRINVGGPIDSLIVCTKAHATSQAFSGLAHRLRPSSVVALLQNGMGVYDELCAKFWPEPAGRPHFVLGTTTHGVTPVAGQRGCVEHMSRPGEGAIRLGVVPDPRGRIDIESWLWGRRVQDAALAPPPSPTLPLPPLPSLPADIVAEAENLKATLEALLSMSALSPSILPMPHLYHELLLKLAMNAAINPLTAVLGGGYLTNGSLHRSGPGHRLVQQVLGEVSTILTAYLDNLSAPHPAPPDVARAFSKDALVHRAQELIQATRDNTSSMASDVRAGRTTEIDYINGFIVSLGQRLGLPAPVNRALVQMVKFRAEVAGLNQRLYPVHGVVRRGEEDALARRQLALEEQKVALEERKVVLAEERAVQAKRERRRERRRLRREAARSGASGASEGSESGGSVAVASEGEESDVKAA